MTRTAADLLPPAPPLGTALGVVAGSGRPGPSRIVAPAGTAFIDVGTLAAVQDGPHRSLLAEPTLDGLLAAGRPAWRVAREWLAAWLADPEPLAPYALPRAGAGTALPFCLSGY